MVSRDLLALLALQTLCLVVLLEQIGLLTFNRLMNWLTLLGLQTLRLFALLVQTCLLRFDGHTTIPGLWTEVLNAGLWTLDPGLWTLKSGLWMLKFGRWVLDTGHCRWLFQNRIRTHFSDLIKLLKIIWVRISIRTSWSRSFCKDCRFWRDYF